MNKFWQWWAPGKCIPFSTILVSLEPPNSLIDFALVILALSMIRSLRIKTKAKWKLRFLFGLGSLAGIFGFVKIGMSYNSDQAFVSAALGLWAVVQSVVGIVCCCAPVYKPLFPGQGYWSRLNSKVINYTFGGFQRSRSCHGTNASSNPRGERQGWIPLNRPSTDGKLPTTNNIYPLESIEVRQSIEVSTSAV
ncbi:hypothetical protein EAF04_006120 [Stromatinia cepivora]|nr:hypothetical protein EAF04_006120 [Stromatinia cepivora]